MDNRQGLVNALLRAATSQMKFKIHKSRDGQYYWTLVGGNGEVMGQSETMTRKQSVKDAIASIQAHAAAASIEDITGER